MAVGSNVVLRSETVASNIADCLSFSCRPVCIECPGRWTDHIGIFPREVRISPVHAIKLDSAARQQMQQQQSINVPAECRYLVPRRIAMTYRTETKPAICATMLLNKFNFARCCTGFFLLCARRDNQLAQASESSTAKLNLRVEYSR